MGTIACYCKIGGSLATRRKSAIDMRLTIIIKEVTILRKPLHAEKAATEAATQEAATEEAAIPRRPLYRGGRYTEEAATEEAAA